MFKYKVITKYPLANLDLITSIVNTDCLVLFRDTVCDFENWEYVNFELAEDLGYYIEVKADYRTKLNVLFGLSYVGSLIICVCDSKGVIGDYALYYNLRGQFFFPERVYFDD